ncbi:PREDICTED: QWRF motif-containing protein 3 [Fragaria vesca subsp. vesca]|uniref:QWRF motif-containing protein 3 n=1 Tax=Fragaria vesca subsp. vesca TaxID=101020 RepID=UPI0002C2EA8F|nr:PREDICTED: QWRF motif-containing protein 3 [Fragaria vesca subsp. vesca]
MDHSHKPRRPKSREVSSRFLSPTTPEPSSLPSPNHPLSPARRKPSSPVPDTRKPDSSIRGGLWPSATTPSIKNFDSLAVHLGIDRLKDRTDRNISTLVKSRSRREENEKDNAKENHRPVIGGSARYTGKFNFSGKSSPSPSSYSTSTSSNKLAAVVVPGRFSVDGSGVYQNSGRRSFDNFADSLDSGSEISDASSSTNVNIGSPCFGVQSSTASSRKLGVEVSSKYMTDIQTKHNHRRWTSDSNLRNPSSAESSPKMNKFNLKNVIKRANSLTGSKSGTTQWALSPGRSATQPVPAESLGKSTSFSSLKPPNSPSKSKGVEKLINMGFELFKSRKSSSSTKSLARSNSGYGVTDTGHQLRLLHNRLMQWRYANARAEIVNENVADQAQGNFFSACDSLLKLRQSVLHKKLKLQKERLEMKLNLILHSQFKPLEEWGDTERQHMGAVSMMKECLHSVVCRVPLVEGAKVDTQLAAIHLRNASDYSASIKLILATFAPSAEQTGVLLSELAEVVAQEKLLSDGCLELCRSISALEMEERSLKCSIIQLESWKQEQIQLQLQQPRQDIMP